MTINVAINGFGRIGRLVFRALIEQTRTDIRLVAINDICPLPQALHLFRYDSVHGRPSADVSSRTRGGQEYIVLGDQEFSYVMCPTPKDLPWKELDVDLVLECSGRFASHDACQAHLDAGAKRVLVSAPCKNADYTVVYGVNHQGLQPDHRVISNASCTTNCLAPIAKVLNDNFGITAGYMTTVHAYTNDQRMVDSVHSDLRRARAGAANLIPTSTGAASAVGLVLPELAGKLEGSAVRVPVPNVSLVDLVCTLERPASVDKVNTIMHEAATGVLKGVLECSDLPLVSSDFCHHPASSILDSSQTHVVGDNMLRVLSWYDNEWGFSNRMIDTACALSKIS